VADAIMREDNREATSAKNENPIETSVNSNTQDRVRQEARRLKASIKSNKFRPTIATSQTLSVT
jgi:hypothetical protein